jgi:hypothetical protein
VVPHSLNLKGSPGHVVQTWGQCEAVSHTCLWTTCGVGFSFVTATFPDRTEIAAKSPAKSPGSRSYLVVSTLDPNSTRSPQTGMPRSMTASHCPQVCTTRLPFKFKLCSTSAQIQCIHLPKISNFSTFDSGMSDNFSCANRVSSSSSKGAVWECCTCKHGNKGKDQICVGEIPDKEREYGAGAWGAGPGVAGGVKGNYRNKTGSSTCGHARCSGCEANWR